MAMTPRGGGAGPNRPGRTTTVRPVYETFTPVFQRQQDEEAEKLLIYLPGFLKENIRVSKEGKTTLKVRGERLIGSNKWNRVVEEFQVPEDCNMGGIGARFENGILTITMPITKKIPPPAATVTPQQQKQEETPYIPPFLRTKDDHSPPPLPPQTTPDIQNQPKLDFPPNISQPTPPIQPKPLKGGEDEDNDDDFATKSVERQKQATPLKTPLKGDGRDEDSQKETTPPKVTDGEDFPDKTSQFSSVESQKKPALRPMFPKDYHQDEESPPEVAPSVLAAGAKHGDQKSLEDQEKGGKILKLLIGLKNFVQEEKSSEVKAKGTITQTFDGRNKTSSAEKERTGVDKDEQKEKSVKQTSMTGPIISGGGGDFRLGKAVKAGGVTDPKDERQLLVNAGVAVLVILALGAYIYNTVGTRKSD